MADYSKYKMETLLKMKDRAYEKYYNETIKSCGNWGDGMRLSKLRSLSGYEKAKERYDEICKEIENRNKDTITVKE